MPDRKWKPQGAKPEFEVAWYTKELGKPLQRQMLQQQLARLSESRIAREAEKSRGEDAPPQADASPQADATPPEPDRAD